MKHHRQRCARRWGIVLCLGLTVMFTLRQFSTFLNINDNRNPDQDASRVFYFDPTVASSHRKVALMSEHSIISEYADFMAWQPWEHDRCQYPAEWQRIFHPTCNILHELEHTGKLVGSGYWRQGWLLDDVSVLKRGEFPFCIISWFLTLRFQIG